MENVKEETKTKVCKVCGREKLIGEYYKHTEKSTCKVCVWSSKHEDLNTINELSKEENLIILDMILNEKVKFMNEFEAILNKPLREILLAIQLLNIRNIKLAVNKKCDVCDKDITYKISEYLNRTNCFCSQVCHDIFQSYSYGCKEDYQRCGKCDKEKPYSEFNNNGNEKRHTNCNVCDFFKRRSVNIINDWTFKEYKIIVDNLLNKKVNCINDIIPLLDNRSLENIIDILKTELKTSGVEIKIRFKCESCNIDSYLTIYEYLKNEHHFCSKDCYDTWQSLEIEMTCKWCGTEFNRTPLKGQENYFCCHDCSTKYHAKERTKDLVVVNCAYCGEEFERKGQNKKKIYCSDECRARGFNIKVSGKNNAKYVERLKVICDWCSKEFEETENSYNQSINHFCGRECQHEYHAKVFSQTPEWKEFMRIEMVNRLSDGILSHTDTKPQLIVNDILNELDVANENEYNCKYYAIDNHLIKSNLFIECNGTFWHTDHRVYDAINYLSQATGISKDKSKKTYIKKYYNIDILYLWEYDINNNRKLCKELIQLYINNKGVLSNYHSFNYHLNKDNKIIINDIIDIPYMDYDIEDLNKIVDLSVREARSNYQPDKHIAYNCEYCGKESSDMITHYNTVEHHFCSNSCNASYYGEKRLKSKQLCSVCGNNIPHKNGLCKVCTYKSKHNMAYSEKWTEEITDIILNNVLYKRIEYLNDLEDILNIPLKDICEYIKIIGYVTTLRAKRTCLACGEEFTLPMNRIIAGKDKCCTKECGFEYQKRDRIKFNCECCNKEVEVKPSLYKRSENHFCSHECADQWRWDNYISTKVNKICAICGIDYQVVPSQSESVVCSRECQGKWQSLHLIGENANGYNHEWSEEDRTLACEWCGNIHTAKPYQIENGRRFCSNECRREWWSKEFIINFKNKPS